MNLSLGIIGLPNVGKSTLFNALTNNNIPAENYPFCTIDPNVGIVPIADPRLNKLTELVNPAKTTPAVVEFWDIAGLVKGASKGEGLGNQFLANIRNVSAIVHVIRAFTGKDIHHVEETIDPKRDIELINAELILKDLETLENSMSKLQGKARANPKLKTQLQALENLTLHLEKGNLASTFSHDEKDEELSKLIKSLFLLTTKPTIFLLNCEESKSEENLRLIKPHIPKEAIVICMDIKLEAEISALPENEQKEYLEELGMNEPALNRLTREAYSLLGLISFFTAGEQEVRAWTIKKGTKAPQAAGVIHTDFEKRFITTEVVAYRNFLDAGGWHGSKEQGKMRLGGKEYVIRDGDVVLFKYGL